MLLLLGFPKADSPLDLILVSADQVQKGCRTPLHMFGVLLQCNST